MSVKKAFVTITDDGCPESMVGNVATSALLAQELNDPSLLEDALRDLDQLMDCPETRKLLEQQYPELIGLINCP